MSADYLANLLRVVRQQHGLSVRGLAKKLNVSPTTISNLEHARQEPDMPTARKIRKFTHYCPCCEQSAWSIINEKERLAKEQNDD